MRRLAREGGLELALNELDRDQLVRLATDWQIWARDDQLPPAATATGRAWRTWLILGGRGAGKTRAGAEWVRAEVAGAPSAFRIALVGETLDAARAVMVEGVSGLLAVHPPRERPRYEAARHRLVWPGGSIAELFSAETPSRLRGPQFHAAWCDEICKWRHAEETWDMLQFGLRLGSHPRQVVTTTPRAMPLLRRLIDDGDGVAVSRARTRDNEANLAATFLAAVEERYGASLLGRQELDGELIEDREDALWRRDWFERHRVAAAPPLARIVVAIDPPVTAHAGSDACGLVVAAKGEDGRAYVLADETLQRAPPHVWATYGVRLLEAHGADCIVAEVNQGGDLVDDLLQQIRPGVAVRQVRASRGKWVRAEPVAALYARGLVSHVGHFPALEDQLAAFGPDGLAGRGSPDRMDALVWALTELMLVGGAAPRLRTV